MPGAIIILIILALFLIYGIVKLITNSQLKKQRRIINSYGTEKERLEFTKSRKPEAISRGIREDKSPVNFGTDSGTDKSEHLSKGDDKPERTVLLPDEPALSPGKNMPGDGEKQNDFGGDDKGIKKPKRKWKRKLNPKKQKNQEQTGSE
jgi:hypothetical protein